MDETEIESLDIISDIVSRLESMTLYELHLVDAFTEKLLA